jgi:hypothetical protein
MDYSKLFIDNYPIIYYNNDEPYMPVDFEDILNISKIKPINLHKVSIIYLYEEDKYNNNIGKQILCKTNGYIEIDGIKYIDLIYIITYLWTGNKYNEHPFDKSTVIVRLDENKKLNKVCCINKDETIWYESNKLELENNRPVLISSYKTHNLYNEEYKLKNILLERDYIVKDIKWEPSEFVIYDENIVKLIDIDGNNIEKDIDYYLYDKNIGDEKTNQQMPSSIEFDTIKMEAFYNYNGDIFNLFNDYKNGISLGLILKTLLLVFIVVMIIYDMIKYKPNIFNVAYIVGVVALFLASTI